MNLNDLTEINDFIRHRGMTAAKCEIVVCVS